MTFLLWGTTDWVRILCVFAAVTVTALDVAVVVKWAFEVTMVGVAGSARVVARVILLVCGPVPMTAGGGGMRLLVPAVANGVVEVVDLLGVGWRLRTGTPPLLTCTIVTPFERWLLVR